MALAISDVTPRVSYTVGAAPQSVFAVPFVFLLASDLKVYVGGTLKTLTTHYTVSGAGLSAGGSVTLVTSVASTTVLIERSTGISRMTDFPVSGPLAIDALNAEFDRVFLILQELQTQIDGLTP